MNNICLVITLIISIQYVGQTYGSCDRFTNNYVFCRINGVPYDKGNLIYAFEPETFPIILELPRLTRDTTDATGTCSRIFVNGTETKCSDKDCTLPICLFQIYDPEPAERVFINAVSNDLSCQPMNFTFYVNGITLLAPIYAIEGVDVIFQWMYPFEVDGIKWFRGGENGELLMTYIPGNGEPATEEGFHVNYINEPNSVGMVLPNVTMAATANYTVLVNITDNILDKTTTTLTIITANAYEDFMNRTSIIINGMPSVYYGQPIGAVDSGNISIETNVPDDYGENSTTVCSQTSTNGENVTCGNCSNLNCHFIVTGAIQGDVVTVKIEIDSIQGGSSIDFTVVSQFLTCFKMTIGDTFFSSFTYLTPQYSAYFQNSSSFSG